MRTFAYRKGLSTVVTSAIMLTAVAIMGSSLVAWSNGNLRSYETVLSTLSADKINKVNEKLSIENVVFCHTNCPSGSGVKSINITLTNIGSIGLNVTKIQINGTSYSWTTSPLPLALYPKNSTTYHNILPWTSQSTDTITITTARNKIFTTQVVPP